MGIYFQQLFFGVKSYHGVYHAIYIYVTGDVFNNFCSRGKVTMMFVPTIAGLWYVNYHTAYIELIECMFQQHLFTRSKAIMVFVRDLSGVQCIC